MRKLTTTQFWERLEKQDWLYAWIDDPVEYSSAVAEAKALNHFSRLSDSHTQLYSTYWYFSYTNVTLDEDNSVMNSHKPISRKPEAA